MPDTLLHRWLVVTAFAATLMAGVHPAVLSYVVLLMGFLWIFMGRDVRGHFAKPNSVTTILFLLSFVYAAVALQWSLLPARGLYDLTVVALMTWMGLQTTAGMAEIDAEHSNKLLRMVVGTFLVALIFFAADLFLDRIVQRALLNAPWSKALPLALTTRSCLCLVLLLWPVLGDTWRRGWHRSAIALWLLTGALTIFADTAAGRLAFAVSTLIFVVARFSPRVVRLALCAVIVAGFILAVPVSRHIQDDIGQQAGHMSGSFGQRTEIWQFTAKRILEKPIFGWGFDSARAIPNFGEVSKYLGGDPTKSIIPMHTHNWFLHILLELGAVGAVLVGAFWIWLITRTEKLSAAIQPHALAVIGVVFSIGAFSIGVWQAWWWAAVIFVCWVLQWFSNAQGAK